MDDRARDALANVTAEQVPDLAARWARIKEFRRFSDGPEGVNHLAKLVSDLAALSRRAQSAGEHLYCWWSV